jgi:hypothetical protein
MPTAGTEAATGASTSVKAVLVPDAAGEPVTEERLVDGRSGAGESLADKDGIPDLDDDGMWIRPSKVMSRDC